MNVLLLFLIAFTHPTLLLLDCVDQLQPLMLPDRIIFRLCPLRRHFGGSNESTVHVKTNSSLRWRPTRLICSTSSSKLPSPQCCGSCPYSTFAIVFLCPNLPPKMPGSPCAPKKCPSAPKPVPVKAYSYERYQRIKEILR